MPCAIAVTQKEARPALPPCDAPALVKAFRDCFGREPSEGEQATLDAISSDRDRRRMVQVMEFSKGEEEALDITKIALPKLPEGAEADRVVDEELDPVAWRQIARLCSTSKAHSHESASPTAAAAAAAASASTSAPAIAPKPAEVSGADFVSVKEKRALVKGEQAKQHCRLTEVLSARKEKRLAERRSRIQEAQQIPKHALSEEQLKKLKSDQVGAESGERVSAVTSAIASKAARPEGHPGAQKPAEDLKEEELVPGASPASP